MASLREGQPLRQGLAREGPQVSGFLLTSQTLSFLSSRDSAEVPKERGGEGEAVS